ncbi:MAG: hypothetical protein RJA13_2062 [Bacteroidota bacterium]
MEYMLIVREGFREEVEKNMLEIEKFTNEELVQAYNRQVKIGIVGLFSFNALCVFSTFSKKPGIDK